jgi:hypothetical protein
MTAIRSRWLPQGCHSWPLPLVLALPLVTALSLAAAPSATAQDLPGAPILGAGLTGWPEVISGDVVLEGNGVVDVIRDYADADSPRWYGWYDHAQEGVWGQVVVDGDLAVGLRAGTPRGLDILSLDDLAAPDRVASLEGNTYTAAWLRGPALYLSLETALFVYDLSDPADPRFRQVVPLGESAAPRAFSRVGDRLLLIDRAADVRILDITDPLAPLDRGVVSLDADRLAGLVAGDGVVHALEVTGDALALATHAVTGDGTLPRLSRRALTGTPPGGAVPLARRGDLLLVGAPQVQAFDVSQPADPQPTWQRPLAAAHLAISASRVFVGTSERLQIYPRLPAGTDPGTPVQRKVLPRLNLVTGQGPVQVAQDHADRSVLWPVQVADPTSPQLGLPFDTGVDGDLVVQGTLGAMVDLQGVLQLVDLTDPSQPSLAGRYEKEGLLFGDAFLAGDLLVLEILTDAVALTLLDVSDPQAPRRITALREYGTVAVGEGLLVCRRNTRVILYDVSDPERPKEASRPGVRGRVLDAVVSDGHLHVLTEIGPGQATVQSLDVTDPGDPQPRATVTLPRYATALAVHAHRLYAYGFTWGQILTIAEPAQPQLVSEFPALGQSGRGLAFNGDVTTVGGWLVTVRDETFAPAAAGRDLPAVADGRLRVAPNPFNPRTTVRFATARARTLTLTVHDLRGRRVATLAQGRFAAGTHTLRWDGRDRAGLPVASGTYLLRLHGDGLAASRTVTLIK